jgi:hypothetical protein
MLTVPPDLRFYLIRGRVIPEKKQRLYSYLQIVIQSVDSHLRKIGMRDVSQIAPDLIAFRGGPGSGFLKSDFGLEENIDRGLIRISTEGSEIAAFYYLGFLNRFATRWFIPVGLISLIAFFQTDLRFFILPFLAAALIIPFLATIFIVRWGIRKELLRAFQTAEDMIEFRSDPGSTSPTEHNAWK